MKNNSKIKFKQFLIEMKYILQFCIILAVSLVGELLNRFIPLPIPASVYGMILLFLALMTGVIKLSHVRATGRFLIDILPLLFVAPAVGLIESWTTMQEFWLAVVVISLISTIAVVAISGRITQFIINRKGGKND